MFVLITKLILILFYSFADKSLQLTQLTTLGIWWKNIFRERKISKKKKMITIASDGGKNMMKALSDLVITYIMIFVLTL